MTAKERLHRTIDDLTEVEAAEVLEMLSHSQILDGTTATRILDGIEGALERAHLGSEELRAGRGVSADELERGS